MLTVLWLILLIGTATALAYVNVSGAVWAVTGAAFLGVAWVAGLLPPWLTLALAAAFVIVMPALVVPGPSAGHDLTSGHVCRSSKRPRPR